MHEHADADALPDSQEGVQRGKLFEGGAHAQQLPLEALRVLLHVQVLREEEQRNKSKTCSYSRSVPHSARAQHFTIFFEDTVSYPRVLD